MLALCLLRFPQKSAYHFLQGQISCNLKDLHQDNWLAGFFANEKGQAIANFLLFLDEGDFCLLVPKSNSQRLKSHLAKYLPFYRLEWPEGLDVECVFEPELQGLVQKSEQLRFADVPERSCKKIAGKWQLGISQGIALHIQFGEQSSCDLNLGFLLHGWIWVEDNSPMQLVHMFSSLENKAISYDKGCFTGQEIFARIHYKGSLKKQLCFKTLSQQQLELTEQARLLAAVRLVDGSFFVGIID